jgi:hypothetical protein
MVERDELVGDRYCGSQQIADCTHDVLRLHVASPVVFFANNEDAGMMASSVYQSFVQFLEIAVVVRPERSLVE